MPTRTSPSPRRATTRATTRSSAAAGAPPAPRLPHEHDESSDSVDAQPTDVMRQAHADLVAGQVDTDRGGAADAAYRRQKGGAAPPRKR